MKEALFCFIRILAEMDLFSDCTVTVVHCIIVVWISDDIEHIIP